MKTLMFAAIRCSLMFMAVTGSVFSAQPAQAFTMTIEQVGSNVIATGSGAFNLTGLTLSSGQFVGTRIAASFAIITMSPELLNADADNGFTGPTSFGPGDLFSANSFTETFSLLTAPAPSGVCFCYRAMS